MTTRTVWRIRLSNYGCGLLAALAALGCRGLGVAAFKGGHQVGMQLFPAFSVLGFVLTFIAIDLLYYLQHRLEHRVPVLWAIHSVHHQAELCDTSVSLRISVFASAAVGLFHLPLAFLGVEPTLYLAAYGVHAAIVFCFHARLPKWLDRVGWVFNSPLVHRLHHASNVELRDQNFAGVFVVWDRLFGTFRGSHQGPLVFGVDGEKTPLSPLEANIKPWRGLFSARSGASGPASPATRS